METMESYARRRDQTNLDEMVERIGRKVRTDGAFETFPGVHLTRVTRASDCSYGVSKPAFCVIVQGAKEVYLGDTVLRYDPQHYLLATVELPVKSLYRVASEKEPLLSVRIDLDPALVGSVMVEADVVAPASPASPKAMVVNRLDSDLLDATAKLVRLLDSPADARVLAPLVKREVVYRLLTGAEGDRLRHFPMPGGHTQRIAQALERLRREFDRPLSMEQLAQEVGMSSTRFHHHFKAVTDMSPLQFQKQIRLQEARRLMLGEDLDAASAGYRVGYEDASHFSRDYKRHFGESPMRDVERLKASLVPA
jgi:AraC-like DNA-binding protein